VKRLLAALGLTLLAGGCTTSDIAVKDMTAAIRPVAPVDDGILPLAEEEHITATRATSAPAALGYAGKPRFGDADPFDFGRRSPHAHGIHGIDIAKYQGAVDFERARASGVSFAYLKATEGGDRVDDRFAANWQAAANAGMPRGAYHFYYFCRSAAEQAKWFIRHVPRTAGALPPALDMEWNPQSPSCKKRPSPDVVRREMKVFLTAIEKHYGKKPVIYTTPDFFEDNDLGSFKGYKWWLRATNSHPDDKYGAMPWVFWQYTGTGRVPGVNGDADINVFRGDHREWKGWLAANAG